MLLAMHMHACNMSIAVLHCILLNTQDIVMVSGDIENLLFTIHMVAQYTTRFIEKKKQF